MPSSYRLLNNIYLNGHEREEEIKKDISHASSLMRFMKELLERKIDKIERDMESKEMYELPAFSYKVAGMLESRRELRDIMKLFEEVDQPNE